MNIILKAVGADPELFFSKDGHPVSAEGFVPGTKDEPCPMRGLPEGFFIQLDNVSAEYNVPPATSDDEFAKSIQKGVKYIEKLGKKYGFDLLITPDAMFAPQYVNTPHALTLGCEPDYNVWTLDKNPRPKPPAEMRTAAGHVHVSWGPEVTPDLQVMVGRALDLYLGVPSILITEPNNRRQLYGKAGAVRYKPYGIEYRTLDNFWIKSPIHSRQVFANVAECIYRLSRNPEMERYINLDGDVIQTAINDHNRDLAAELVDKYMVPKFAHA